MSVYESRAAVRETAGPGGATRVHGQGASLRRAHAVRFVDAHVDGGVVQRQEGAGAAAPAAAMSHSARLPDPLRTSVERLSGLDMSDVRVHYRSPEPARVQALAYAQGDAIHLGPGQEQHLPHEAWHIVQQKQGRVRATSQFVGVGLNDDISLEHEADRMGAMAARGEVGDAGSQRASAGPAAPGVLQAVAAPAVMQRVTIYRNGNRTPANFTPRDPQDVNSGLSMDSVDPGGTRQRIDTTQLNNLEAINDHDTHYSVRPRNGTGYTLLAWAQTRAALLNPGPNNWTNGNIHALTTEVDGARF